MWYRTYSDSWLEQGGVVYVPPSTVGIATTVNYIKKLKKMGYYVNCIGTGLGASGWQYANGYWMYNVNTTNLTIGSTLGVTNTVYTYWTVLGY